MTSALKKRVSFKLVISTLLLYYCLFFTAYIIPSPISRTILESIPMDQVLDLQKDGYSTQEATTFFSILGERGRSIYIRNLWTIDLIMPFLSALSFALLIYFITARLRFLHPGFRLLSLIPFITAILDYTENTILTFDVLRFPQISEFSISIADICTRLKWNFISGTSIMSVLLLLLLAGIKIFSFFKKS